MGWIRRFRKWLVCRKYGVCPTHFTLMTPGGGYEPRWTCEACHNENMVKHKDRLLQNHDDRFKAVRLAKQLDAG